MRHNIEVVVDRLAAKPSIRPRLAEAVDLAIKLGKGSIIVAVEADDGPSPPGRGGGEGSKKPKSSKKKSARQTV